MNVLNTIFLWVIFSSVTGSSIAILILTFKKIFGKKLGARLHSALWVLVIVRLVIPIIIQSPLNIMNFLPQLENRNTISTTTDLLRERQLDLNSMKNNNLLFESNKTSKIEKDRKIDTAQTAGKQTNTLLQDSNTKKPFANIQIILSVIWLAGVIISIILFIISTIKFRKNLKCLKKPTDAEFIFLIQFCRKKLKIKKEIPIYISNCFKSPCLYGFLKPKIFLPEDILNKVDRNQLLHILMHEFAHYKRRDPLHSLFCCIALVIHWFNPIVWLITKKIRIDREIACDAYVLEILGENEVISYGKTLISLITVFPSKYTKLPTAGFVETGKQIEKRIIMIKKFKKGSYKMTISAAVCLAIVGTTVVTFAVSSKKINTSVFASINTIASRAKSQLLSELENEIKISKDEQKLYGSWAVVDSVDKVESFKRPEKIEPYTYTDKSKVLSFEPGAISHSYTTENDSNSMKIYVAYTWDTSFIKFRGSETIECTIGEFDTTKEFESDQFGDVKLSYLFIEGNKRLKGMEDNGKKYVLRKLVDSDYPKKINLANTNIPKFVDDPEIIGDWDAFTFVKNINDFNPNDKSLLKSTKMMFDHLKVFHSGKMITSMNSDATHNIDIRHAEDQKQKFRWTKGFFLDQYVLENSQMDFKFKYEIKTIEGNKYLFQECKELLADPKGFPIIRARVFYVYKKK